MSYLDLSSHDIPPHFKFSEEYPKSTLTGLMFLSFEGLRAYLITGSKYNEYLQGNITYANQNYKPEYIYVADLKQQLVDTLKVEMANSPFLKLKYGPSTEVVWSKMGITPAQEEWVQVVREALKSL